MDLIQLRCFSTVAEEMHFGRAAQRLDMLPASLGRHLKKLEDSLGTQLVLRTTRHVSLTDAGADLLNEARQILIQAESFEDRARNTYRAQSKVLRIGAIDSASVGLLPQLLNHFRQAHPEIDVTLHEQKTIRLLPRLQSGRLDLAFVRPPDRRNPKLMFKSLLSETAVVAVPEGHRLADRTALYISDLEDEPLIVPDRRSRPHSHDLTIKLFLDAGLTARIAQIAEEKNTIVNMVGSGLGLAIVPRWTSRLAIQNVRFIPIMSSSETPIRSLQLSAVWIKNTRDPVRDLLLECLDTHLPQISVSA